MRYPELRQNLLAVVHRATHAAHIADTQRFACGVRERSDRLERKIHESGIAFTPLADAANRVERVAGKPRVGHDERRRVSKFERFRFACLEPQWAIRHGLVRVKTTRSSMRDAFDELHELETFLAREFVTV